MQSRYALFKDSQVRNIYDYNSIVENDEKDKGRCTGT